MTHCSKVWLVGWLVSWFSPFRRSYLSFCIVIIAADGSLRTLIFIFYDQSYLCFKREEE